MLKRLHAAAGCLALPTLLSFWISTVVAEGFLDGPAVVAVKSAIVNGLFVLVPAMAVAGMTGAALARGRGGLVAVKTKRMKILAANGVLVMIPAALFLNYKATASEMDGLFFLVQVIELAVGAVQIAFMVMNARDGLRMAGRLGGRRAHV
jgi:hypothetical protein